MSEPQTRAAPLSLWEEMRTLLQQMLTLFGSPSEIARQHTLTAQAHKLLAAWLRGAEALLRHLLLIEAAAAPAPAARNWQGAKSSARRAKRLREFWPDKPEQWAVAFRVTVSSPACGGSGAHAARVEGGRRLGHAARDASSVNGGAKFFSAWPLAERVEVLLRVLENPAPYVRRLAHRLRAKPARAARLARPIAHRGVIPGDIAHHFAAQAAKAAGTFKDSS